jgi:glycosyltransferase involved in cell wall biosynthesis
MLLENNPYPGDVRVRAEAESLAAAGYIVEVVAPRACDQPRHESLHGVQVRRFRAFEARGQSARLLLAEYLVAAVALHGAAVRALARGTTVLHLHNPPDLLFPAAALFRLAGRSVVFDHHDLAPETIEAKFGPGPLSRLARICERLTFACANHVLATNASYAEVARERGRKSSADVTIVRNAPPSSWTRTPLRVRDGELHHIELVYVGAIASQDGVGGLAPILARLCGRDIDAHLTVVGDGDARQTLESELARHGVAERVTITGWVRSEEVPGLIESADVCVDPAPASDVNQRSTMIKIAEYLALGKPVVAYDLLETRRTAADAALLAPPGNVAAFAEQIAELAQDADLRRRLSRDARKRAAELTWNHSERALLIAYRTITAEDEPSST